MTDPTFLPAHRLAAMVRAREVGCLELAEHFIARIERLDVRINAVVVRDLERARERARAMDAGGPPEGPLAGVPVTVKESFDVEGLPTTWGLAERAGHAAASDALAVRRLRAAGAVVLGKTNVPVMLADWQSFNPVYGASSNPWDPARSPGGSSGGSAAATAAGFSGLEMGSDIGGSIRQPAHACGVFGHKPSWGLLPPTGHALAERAAMGDISCIGPLARSAEDLRVAVEVLAGPDEAETALRLMLPPPRLPGLRGLRVAVWAGEAGRATEPAITAALLDLAEALEREGAVVSPEARPAFDPARSYDTYLHLLGAALGSRASASELAETRARAAACAPDDPATDAVLARAATLTHAEWVMHNEQRQRDLRLWTAFFRDWDVLLCPVMGCPAFRHAPELPTWERRITVAGRELPYNEMLFWPGLIGGALLPATAVPLARMDGLPVGAQVVGPMHGDRTTLHVAGLLERAWRGFEAPGGWG